MAARLIAGLATLVALGLWTSVARGEPWPVAEGKKLDAFLINEPITIPLIDPHTGQPTLLGNLRQLPQNHWITSRQQVNGTVGEPRSLKSVGGMTRFHLGTDIQGTSGTSVFAIAGGDVTHSEAGKWDERIDVGAYHYVHVKINPTLDGFLARAERLQKTINPNVTLTITIAAGTLIGTTNNQDHCHLEYEPVTNHVQDSLRRLVPWSDTVAPRFTSDPAGAPWRLPPVRVVHPFDPLDLSEVVPHLFGHTLPANADSGTYPIPVVSGSVDVLARCMDALGTPSGGAASGGSQNAAPVDLGFGLDELPSSMLPPASAARRVAVPYHTTISFDDVPRNTPAGTRTDTSCRHVYWVNHTIGSRAGAGSGTIRNLDYIVTSAMTDHAPLDTDDGATRNGRYQFVVKAHDVAGTAANAQPNEAITTRTCVICNAPGAPVVTDLTKAATTRSITLADYNLFSPLVLPTRKLPTILFAQGSTSTSVVASGGSGTNSIGTVDVTIPPSIDIRHAFGVAIEVPCNPDNPSDLTASRPVPVVITSARAFICPGFFVVHVDPACIQLPTPGPPVPTSCAPYSNIQIVGEVISKTYFTGGYTTIGGVKCTGQRILCDQYPPGTPIQSFETTIVATRTRTFKDELAWNLDPYVCFGDPLCTPPCLSAGTSELISDTCTTREVDIPGVITTLGVDCADPVTIAPVGGGLLGPSSLTVVAGGIDDPVHTKTFEISTTSPDLEYVLGLKDGPGHSVGPCLILADGRVLGTGHSAALVGSTRVRFVSGDTEGIATLFIQAYNTLPLGISMVAPTPSFGALDGVRLCTNQKIAGPVLLTCDRDSVGGHSLQFSLEQAVPESAAVALDPGPVDSSAGDTPPPAFSVWPGQALAIQLRVTDLTSFDAAGHHPSAVSPVLLNDGSCR